MSKKIELLDCTLRDGAYIVESKFGTAAIRGIMKKMQDANVDIIECGWLKNDEHIVGTSFYHVPDDLQQYIMQRNGNSTYVAMIDWDRYDLNYLPEYDGMSIDAIRVVFPHGKYREGIAVGRKIQEKGYQVFFQAADTLAYSDRDLVELAEEINKVHPVALSVVDTFGAMYEEDLDRIIPILDRNLNADIHLGFHSHNNQQLSFALTMHFIKMTAKGKRNIIIDSSLCGMGRGAGNTPTELIASYMNRKHYGNYDMNVIMDAIDMYMDVFMENYKWGYSIPYFIAGVYRCHVNNIAYLQKNHRTNAKDMRNIIGALLPDDRKKYDYGLLEEKYIENQNRIVNDEESVARLEQIIGSREVLLIAPGKSIIEEKEKVERYIKEKNPVLIGVNALNPEYTFDYLAVINAVRYNYAKEVYDQQFAATPKILLSNIKTEPEADEIIINFNRVVRRGWEHFDNAVIMVLRLMNVLHVKNVSIAGFDGFKHKYNESYADASLPTLNPDNKWDELNDEIRDMFRDFKQTVQNDMNIYFVTESIFQQ